MKSPNTPIHTFFADQLANDVMNRTISWASNVKSILDNLGFGYLWNSNHVNSMHVHIFKQRLQDQYIQEWNTSVANQPKLSYYRLFKCEHKYEQYLDIIDNTVLRKSLSRFRLSSHSLEIETGRYTNVERNNRICRLCNMNVVESEYHFMLCCPLYRDLRQTFGINIQFPTLHKFTRILSSKNTRSIRNAAKYVHYATLLRQEKLHDIAAS